MPACPECGNEVEVGAIECPSCGVYPGTFPEDGQRPVIRAPDPLPSSQEPSFSIILASAQALFALFVTLAITWWFHGSLDTTQSMENLVPEIALRLSRGFSISVPSVLLVGFWSAMSNRRDTWLGYGARYLTFALIAAAVTLGPSYFASQKSTQLAAQGPSPTSANPMAPGQSDKLPSTGNAALDARLQAIHDANNLMQQMKALEELQELDQPLLPTANPRPQAQRAPPLDPDELAMCMTDHGAVLYGTPWCGACKHQKRAFGSAIQFINYIDCEYEPEYCATSRIRAYPTWEIAGRNYEGSRPLTELANLSGCAPEGLGNLPDPSASPSPMVTRASYTWRDKNGIMHITSEPPPQDAQKIEIVQ